MRIGFIKIALGVPSTLYSTLFSVWLDLVIGSATDLASVRVTYCVKQVHYTEPQEDRIFLA
jgi:hypothetical protein